MHIFTDGAVGFILICHAACCAHEAIRLAEEGLEGRVLLPVRNGGFQNRNAYVIFKHVILFW